MPLCPDHGMFLFVFGISMLGFKNLGCCMIVDLSFGLSPEFNQSKIVLGSETVADRPIFLK